MRLLKSFIVDGVVLYQVWNKVKVMSCWLLALLCRCDMWRWSWILLVPFQRTFACVVSPKNKPKHLFFLRVCVVSPKEDAAATPATLVSLVSKKENPETRKETRKDRSFLSSCCLTYYVVLLPARHKIRTTRTHRIQTTFRHSLADYIIPVSEPRQSNAFLFCLFTCICEIVDWQDTTRRNDAR